MYGSPLLRFCPACALAATSKARSITLRSAFGWALRTVRSSGSSRGEPVLLVAPSRAIRENTRAGDVRPSDGLAGRGRGGAATSSVLVTGSSPALGGLPDGSAAGSGVEVPARSEGLSTAIRAGRGERPSGSAESALNRAATSSDTKPPDQPDRARAHSQRV